VVAQGWNVDWLAGARTASASVLLSRVRVGSPSGGFVCRVGMDRAGGVGSVVARCWVLRERALLVWGCVSFLLWAVPSVEPSAVPVVVSWAVCLGWWLGVVGRRRVWGWLPPVA
jgi:hypothetical protein